ncbi:flagellar motor protein MotB [Candidatus Poribacteria bacterium]|jgi:flagellar motor protein MotB|nr:flagellar motor protein MotB [Candidatus Poribacteria bacterium]MBT5533087.1 flagellar motor protein MotB [Candidatus Poribacteria bacterium]MBT5709579.1 flagellar motor protein MotB [Candidatus Poribacteria bacterium]MBT7100131.1 flagellar motor protein MotB [Candidatus Poribacteria bacterium]MBT7809143.1 flagellar motor protein MotB [Candidatus Poribacteria bacterium]
MLLKLAVFVLLILLLPLLRPKAALAGKPGELPPTFTDMLALLLTFFVFLMTMAEFDEAKLKDIFAHMSLAFGMEGASGAGVLRGGASMSSDPGSMSPGAEATQSAANSQATERSGANNPGKGGLTATPEQSAEASDLDGVGSNDLPEEAGQPQQAVAEESMIQVAEAEQQKFEQGVLDLGDMPGIDATLTTQGLKIELQEGFARFGSGSTDLPPDAIPKLQALIQEQLRDFIDDSFEISVIGHTDNVPLSSGTAARYSDNRGLSTERANTVLRMFEEIGVNPRQISAQGYGPHNPKADNSTADGRGLNRRIEILVKYKVFSQTDWPAGDAPS